MALFLRGRVWWMEYRTTRVRKVVSTGFRKEQKAQAVAAWNAFRLAMGSKPKRSAVEGILSAIYGEGTQETGLPLSSVWSIYEEWCKGKGRKVARTTFVNHRNLLGRFCEWAEKRGAYDLGDVSVGVAREFVVSLGRSNKTLRTYCGYLSQVWDAIGQLRPGIHNPWKAVTPDNDGSSVRREAFSPDEEEKVLAECKRVGHEWYLASMISRWTGLRYGDVARLDWGQFDLKKRSLSVTPSKTKKHGVRLVLPIADALLEALASRAKETGGEGFVLPEHSMCYPKPMVVPFSAVLEAAGLDAKQFTFHSWRHTFRTRLAEAGVSDDLARRLGGWTNLAMAGHYDHAERLGEMLDAVNKSVSSRVV